METAYDVLKSWTPKFDPAGPKCYVTTGDMNFAGTCGYLTSNFEDEMKDIKVTFIDNDRRIIYGDRM